MACRKPLSAAALSPNRKAQGTTDRIYVQEEMGTAQRKLLTANWIFQEMLAPGHRQKAFEPGLEEFPQASHA